MRGNKLLGPVLIGLLLAAAPAAGAERSIVLRSGNGAVGETDSRVRFLRGESGDFPWGAPLDDDDFDAARNGEAARILLGPGPAAWTSIAEDPAAQWINDGGGGTTALYAVPFNISESFSAASMDLLFAVDNGLGDALNPGIYLNRVALPAAHPIGDHAAVSELHWVDVTDLLRPGENVLYFLVYDWGSWGGLNFSARLNLVSADGDRPDVNVEFVGPPIARPAQPLDVEVIVTNTGTDTLHGVPFVTTFPEKANAESGFDVDTPPGDDPSNPDPEGERPGFLAVDSLDVFGGWIATLPPGEERRFGFTLEPELQLPELDRMTVSAAVGPTFGEFVSRNNDCLSAYLYLGLITVSEFRSGVLVCLGSLISDTNDVKVSASQGDKLYSLWKLVGMAVESTADCAGNRLGRVLGPLLQWSAKGFQGGDIWDQYQETRTACDRAVYSNAAFLRINFVGSLDPNAIVGDDGVGPKRYVASESRLSYSVLFENMSSATAPARTVTIVDTLNPEAYDLASLELGPIGFGDVVVRPPGGVAGYSETVDLRPEVDLLVHVDASLDELAGLLTWRFTSLDPVTGRPPANPLAGFLPPNVSPPEGDGVVSFSVRTRELVTGTPVSTQASIVFDVNDAIPTGTWRNTIDASPPMSTVPGVISNGDDIYSLELDISDPEAGVGAVLVSVSEDGAPPTAVGFGTEAMPVQLVAGHRYAFRTQAVDRVGNVEPSKPTPDFEIVAGGAAAPAPYAYPNPFNRTTTFDLRAPSRSEISITIYDPSGRRVRELRSGGAGDIDRLSWDGRDADGEQAPPGVYLAEIRTGGVRHVTKLTHLR